MLVFVNAFTSRVEAAAQPVAGMSGERFAEIESACRAGRAYDVAEDMLAIMADQPHPDCFLLPSESCPGCGGNEDPCPTCAACAALDSELTDDFLWAADNDRTGDRWRVYRPISKLWIIDSGRELVRMGLLDGEDARLTPLGLDVAHAIRAAQRGAGS